MRVTSASDAGALVRGRRLEVGLSQVALARRAGVSRKWIYEFEAGKPTAELHFLLRVLETLDMKLDIVSADEADAAEDDLSVLLDTYRRE